LNPSHLKRISFTIIGISIFGILMYNISLWRQENNFVKYAFEFNSKRSELGLKEISENWKYEKQNWNNWNELNDENFDDGAISKFGKIFSLKDISAGMIFKNKSINKNENFRSKVIWLNSNILFWKNGIESEMDLYEKNTDSTTVETLSIRYYFEDENGNKNYYEANHSVYDLDILYCGTSDFIKRDLQRISGKPYFGNITKKQADSILTKWNEKN
jgi:hypothetical protein